MDCKSIAVINLSDEEILEIKNTIDANDLNSALKILIKLDKKITNFIEPH